MNMKREPQSAWKSWKQGLEEFSGGKSGKRRGFSAISKLKRSNKSVEAASGAENQAGDVG